MKKSKLINFISKYNLGGLCDKVKIVSKDGKLATSAVTEDKSTLVQILAKNIGIEDGTIGVFNTDGILRILGALQDEVLVHLETRKDTVEAMHCSDDQMEARILLANLEIIPKAPSIKDVPNPEVSFDIDSVFINKFLKAKSALPDAQIMAFKEFNSKINLVLNYADHTTDTITIPLEVECDNGWEILKFNSEHFSKILVANKDLVEGKIELSAQGLMTVTFKGEDTQCKYLVVAMQN